MPNYSDMILRSDTETLIPVEQSRGIIANAVEQSAILRMARRLPNMTSNMLKMPILSNLPMAYFVDGDTGMKQTTKMKWDNKYIVAEEVAVIITVPDNVLEDSDYDIWEFMLPRVTEAFGKVIDSAILYGTNKPASWPNAIVPDAIEKENFLAATDNGYNDIMAPGGLIAKVEDDGYLVNGYLGAMQARSYLRGIVDKNGQPIFRTGMNGGTSYQLDGQNIEFPRNGAVDPAQSLLIAGDWDQLVYAIRQDMTVTRSNTAIINDAEGKIVQNMFQQDSTAFRFVMRMGWQLPNPINHIGGEDRYPFAVLQKAGT